MARVRVTEYSRPSGWRIAGATATGAMAGGLTGGQFFGAPGFAAGAAIGGLATLISMFVKNRVYQFARYQEYYMTMPNIMKRHNKEYEAFIQSCQRQWKNVDQKDREVLQDKLINQHTKLLVRHESELMKAIAKESSKGESIDEGKLSSLLTSVREKQISRATNLQFLRGGSK